MNRATRHLLTKQRRFVIAVNLIGLAGIALATRDVLTGDWTTLDVALLAGFYVLCSGFGISVGFHRCFSHRSFRAAKIVESALAVCGSMAAQGPLFYWVASHRCHHQHSDQELDPHSPRLGFWSAHLGWLLRGPIASTPQFARDLMREPHLARVNRNFHLWVLLGLVAPALVALALTGSATAALHGFIWGGLARLFLGLHAAYAVNSLGHIVGTRPYATHDSSANSFLLALLTFGEGWHNNHHASPRSARFGQLWWQLDAGAAVIAGLAALGIVRDVRGFGTPAAATSAAPNLRALEDSP